MPQPMSMLKVGRPRSVLLSERFQACPLQAARTPVDITNLWSFAGGGGGGQDMSTVLARIATSHQTGPHRRTSVKSPFLMLSDVGASQWWF